MVTSSLDLWWTEEQLKKQEQKFNKIRGEGDQDLSLLGYCTRRVEVESPKLAKPKSLATLLHRTYYAWRKRWLVHLAGTYQRSNRHTSSLSMHANAYSS